MGILDIFKKSQKRRSWRYESLTREEIIQVASTITEDKLRNELPAVRSETIYIEETHSWHTVEVLPIIGHTLMTLVIEDSVWNYAIGEYYASNADIRFTTLAEANEYLENKNRTNKEA